ncbi:MAG: NAD(P)-binding domain-containing protein [Eggerthellales bacterium]|nr:NAD(P)-binding domain-containing protein [Eggerthellales bacterium]
MRFVFAGDTHVGERVSQNLVDAGFELAEGVEEADVVLTYSVTQAALEDMYFDTNGILQLAREGACFIDLSPSTPTFARELYALAQTSNMQSIDAPLVVRDITSHDAYANREGLAVFVGAEESAYVQFGSVLDAIASGVFYMGEPGAGQLAKATQTIQLASQLVGVMEAAALNRAEHQDAGDALRLAVQMGLAAPACESVYRCIADEHFHGTYTAQALAAELAAAMLCAEETDQILPQAEAAVNLIELFLVVGGTDMAVPALSLVYREEEDTKKFGLDWSRAQGMYDDGCGDHECECGHDPNDPNHECCGKHDHGHNYHEDDDYDPYEDEYPSRSGIDYADADEAYLGGFGGYSAN